MPRLAAASIGIALLCASSFAQEPALATVLQRAAAYVADFHHQLAGIVLEEHYVQDVRLTVDPRFSGAAIPRVTHRVLTSDLLLLRPVGADRYVEYRDVFEVDGKPVRDRG